MVGCYLADILEHLALCSSDNVHHVLLVAPLLGGLEHTLVEGCAVVVLGELEVEGPLVGGQRQEDDPLALDGQERLHTVGTHIGGHGDGVEVEVAFGVEEGTGIALAGVADVAALGVGNGEDFAEIAALKAKELQQQMAEQLLLCGK